MLFYYTKEERKLFFLKKFLIEFLKFQQKKVFNLSSNLLLTSNGKSVRWVKVTGGWASFFKNHYIISMKIYGVESVSSVGGGKRKFNQTLCFCTCFSSCYFCSYSTRCLIFLSVFFFFYLVQKLSTSGRTIFIQKILICLLLG